MSTSLHAVLICEPNLLNSTRQYAEARSHIKSKVDTQTPCCILVEGEEAKGKNDPRKQIYKVNVIGKMPIIKFPIHNQKNVYVSHNMHSQMKEVFKEVGKIPTDERTYESIKNTIMSVSARRVRSKHAPAESDNPASTGDPSTEGQSPSVSTQKECTTGEAPNESSASVPQELPDSNLEQVGDAQDQNNSHDVTADHAFPTTARERQKAKEKADKAKGIVRVVNKIKKHVEDHYDDCGESVDGLIKSLRKLGDTEEVFLVTKDEPEEDLPTLYFTDVVETSFFTGHRPATTNNHTMIDTH